MTQRLSHFADEMRRLEAAVYAAEQSGDPARAAVARAEIDEILEAEPSPLDAFVTPEAHHAVTIWERARRAVAP